MNQCVFDDCAECLYVTGWVKRKTMPIEGTDYIFGVHVILNGILRDRRLSVIHANHL